MSSAFWWYVLAGFIVGFSLSTLWEWLYFRVKRVSAIERAVAEQTALRPPADPDWDIIAEEAPQPDSVWATSTAQDPGVYLEIEEPNPATLVDENEDENEDEEAFASPPAEPLAPPLTDTVQAPGNTVTVANIAPSPQAAAATPAANQPGPIPDPQILALAAAIEQLAKAMEKSPQGTQPVSTTVRVVAPAEASEAVPTAFAQEIGPATREPIAGDVAEFDKAPAVEETTPVGQSPFPVTTPGQQAGQAGITPLQPGPAPAENDEAQLELRSLQVNLEERDRQVGALASILTSLRDSLAETLAAKNQLESALAQNQKVLAEQNAALDQLRQESERVNRNKATEVAALATGAAIATEALADKREALQAANVRIAALEAQLQALEEEKKSLVASDTFAAAQKAAPVPWQATATGEQPAAAEDAGQSRVKTAEAALAGQTAIPGAPDTQPTNLLALQETEPANETDAAMARTVAMAVGLGAARATLDANQVGPDEAAEEGDALQVEAQEFDETQDAFEADAAARFAPLDAGATDDSAANADAPAGQPTPIPPQAQSAELQVELEKAYTEKANLEQELGQRTADMEALTARASAAEEQNKALQDELQVHLSERTAVDEERNTRAAEVVALTAGAAAAAAEIQARQEALDAAQSQLTELQAEVEKANMEKAALEAELSQRTADMEALTARASAAEEQNKALQDELQAHLSERAALDEERNTRAAEVVALTAGAVTAADEVRAHQEALAATQEQVAALQAELETAKAEKANREAELAQRNADLDAMTTRAGAAEEQIKALQDERATLDRERNTRAAEVVALTAGAAVAAHAVRARQEALDAAQGQLAMLQAEVEKAHTEKAALEAELGQRTADIEALTACAAAAEEATKALQDELQAHVAERAAVDEDRNTRAAEVVALTAGAAAAAAEVQARQEALEATQGQLTELQAEIEKASAEKASLAQELARRTQALDELTAQAGTTQTSLDETAARRDRLEALLKQRESELAGAKEKLARMGRFESALAVASSLETRHAGKTRAASAAFVAGKQPVLSAQPQPLSEVKGIGPVYQQRLYEAGIGSYWELANLADQDFKELLQLDDVQAQGFDFDKIRSRASRLARDSNTQGTIWDEQRVDDLEMLPGLGKTYERRLYAAGVRTYASLGSLDEEQLAAIVRAPAMRQPDFGLWIAEARKHAQSDTGDGESLTMNGDV